MVSLALKIHPSVTNRLEQQIKQRTKMSQSNETDKVFADGFIFKRNGNAPDFVIGRLSLKASEAIAFINEHQKNGWVNLDIKKARSGNYYIELDTYESTRTNDANGSDRAPQKQSSKPAAKEEEEDLPF